MHVSGLNEVSRSGNYFSLEFGDRSQEDLTLFPTSNRLEYRNPSGRFPFVILLDGIVSHVFQHSLPSIGLHPSTSSIRVIWAPSCAPLTSSALTPLLQLSHLGLCFLTSDIPISSFLTKSPLLSAHQSRPLRSRHLRELRKLFLSFASPGRVFL